MNKLLMIVLMASAVFAFPGCRSHHHNKPQRHPPQHAVRPHHKAPPHAGHHKSPPPAVGPKKAPAPGRKVPPPKR